MMIDREMKTTINNWILQGKEAFLLTGARQIGKTYLIRECLKESKYDYVELNFIERPELVELFENATNAQDLLMRLSLITDKQLNKGKTIIFFDEIQEFKDIVTRIKFLVEEGSFRYIMSGSLLGVELNDLRSAPVGYLRIEDMYPLTVKEFMKAVGIKENIQENAGCILPLSDRRRNARSSCSIYRNKRPCKSSSSPSKNHETI